jgi:hypothetical protein
MLPFRASLPLGLLALALLFASPAAAQRIVAILVDVEGPTEPAMPAGSEVPAGQTLKLGSRSTVNFVHYGTCEYVVVRGGTVVLNDAGYDASGGTILGREAASCPTARRPQLARGNEVSGLGGLRMRGVEPAQAIPMRPRIVVAGVAAREVVAVEVAKEMRTIARMPVRGNNAVWPPDAPTLEPGLGYAVRLFYRGGATSSVPVTVSRDLKADATLPTVLIAER